MANSKRDRVTVIIPAYNSATSIRRTVESALNQEAAPKQVIVVDDGSTDNTVEVVRALGNRVCVLQQSNSGQGAARNAGLEIATGEFIAFLDADDYWRPGFLNATIHFLDQYPDTVAVSTGRITRKFGLPEHIWPQDGELPDDLGREPIVLDNFFDFWAKYDHIRTGTCLIRKSIIDANGGQRADLRVSQDLEFWALIGTCGRWGVIPEPLWVGDPMSAVIERTWMDKYKIRRKLCPTVEQWESRIAERIAETQREAFCRIRGRVAASFAHTHILGGNDTDAWNLVSKYGNEMPNNNTVRMMRHSFRLGSVAWRFGCASIRSRERVKSYLMYRRRNTAQKRLNGSMTISLPHTSDSELIERPT